ncbi:MAG: flagellar motor stator protein MotA [Spongiibacteraceae bacterium]|jgi:chemotaxis protein MotA|nr:flagellar motor stator protein MotA [Spongiibacteraceae bacterium]
MNVILGAAIILACLAIGFLASGGNLLALWQPYELLIIGGAAFGALMISNPMKITLGVLKSTGALLRRSPYNKQLHLELLALLFDLFTKMRREGMLAIESDIDDPASSPVFAKYEMVTRIPGAVEFITDYLRVMMIGSIAGHELEALIDAELEALHNEASQVPGAISRVADALPGFGIVAAVLGIVITMSHIGGPPEELGKHVGAALVGSFLGILAAYGFAGPTASLLEHKNRDEAKFFECIKAALIATLNGAAPQIAVEFGRKVLYPETRPTWAEVDERMRQR